LVKERLSDRDPIPVFVCVPLFALSPILVSLFILTFVSLWATSAAALSAAPASSASGSGPFAALSLSRVLLTLSLRVLRLLTADVGHELGV